jgi:two-component system sensor histidine kinase DesK
MGLPPEQRPFMQPAYARLGVILGLLYLIGPIADLVRADLSPAHKAGIAVGLAAFVALYLSLLPPAGWLRRRDPRWLTGVLLLLPALAIAQLVAGAPDSFVALFVYFVAAAGLLLTPKLALAAVGLTALGVGIAATATGYSDSAVASAVLTIVSIGVLMTAFGRIARGNRELREAREELARMAVTQERLRIARDLHDLLGHSLSVIALKSELAGKLVARDPAGAAQELADIEAVSRQALAEVREAVQGYRGLALDEALDGARAALSAAGIDLRLENGKVDVPPAVETVLAWAVREGTTNVVRHSGAEHCEIRVESDREQVAVEVEDDGPTSTAPVLAGSGLAGLAERAGNVRGTLEAGARPEGGFRLRLTVPLAEP